jgi:hypothetical protein
MAARHFYSDISAHEMTVLHDDGLYRHLRFRRPDTGMYWFDIITWPGCLTLNGDMGSYTFRREPDMINDFFGSRVDDINPGYWAEKVVSASLNDRGNGLTGWDPDRFTQCVTEAFWDYADTRGGPLTATADRLWSHIESDVLAYADDEHEAMLAVRDFEFMAPDERNRTEFVFTDSFEWATHDFNHRFLWNCFAVRWGVNRYQVLKGRAAPLPEFDNLPDPQAPQPIELPAPSPVIVQPKEQYL